MDIKDILSVGLTAEDFDTCIEGLDAIPEKGMAQELMHGTLGLLFGTMANDQRRKEMEQQFKGKMKTMEQRVAARKDDLTILKSKLILLKRLLLSNEALRTVNEILTPR